MKNLPHAGVHCVDAQRRLVLMAAGALALVATGCALPDKPTRPALYDFGPGATTPQPANRMAPLPPIALAEVDASGLLDSTAVLYRLSYADPHQLRPYALARWSMSPGSLLRQRLRETLGARRVVFNADEAAAQTRREGTVPPVLRLELEEFSQHFDSPAQSSGVLRLRATLVDSTPGGERLLGQRTVLVKQPAPTADAPGAVRALTAAADAAIEEISQWLQQAQPR